MIIDIEPLPRNSFAWLRRQIPLFIAAAILACAAWFLFGLVFASTEFPKEYATLGTIGSLCIIFVLFNAMEKARYRRLVDQCELSNIQTDLAKLLSNAADEGKSDILRHYLRKLADAGSGDCVIRLPPIFPDDDLPGFTMPFEPHPFDDLSLQEMQEPDGLRHIEKSKSESKSKQAIVAAVKWIDTSANWIVVAFLLALYLALWFYGGTALAFKALIPVMFGAIAILGLKTLFLIMPAKQIYLVPAGLVIRSTGWLRKRSMLHLFERRNGLLAIFRLNPKLWSLIVADRTQVQSLVASPDRVRQFLRAWLSPLDPPTIEQLSDLS